MPVNRVPGLIETLSEQIANVRRRAGIDPLYLGASSGSEGGIGSPPAGFIGRLGQKHVAYDTDEFGLDTTSSGSSLLDNLNHIRYRLGDLETGATGGASLHKVLRITSGSTIQYTETGSGASLSTALSECVSGDLVWAPPLSIDGNHVVPAGVTLYGTYGSVLTGQITLGDGSYLVGLKVERTTGSAANMIGVVGPSSGTAYIADCHISVVNGGAGGAYGISVGAGNLETFNCYIYGDEYAAYWSSTGTVKDTASRWSIGDCPTADPIINGDFDVNILGWGETLGGTPTWAASKSDGAETKYGILCSSVGAVGIGQIELYQDVWLCAGDYTATAIVYSPINNWLFALPGGTQETDTDQWTTLTDDFTVATAGIVRVGVARTSGAGVEEFYVASVTLAKTGGWAAGSSPFSTPTLFYAGSSYLSGGPTGVHAEWSDRSAWDIDQADGARHASDINNGVFFRHLPTSGSAGDFVRWSGTEWEAVSSAVVADVNYGKIVRLPAGVASELYDPDDAGFAAALADSSNGDIILIPSVTLTGDYEITEGVSVRGLDRRYSIFSGQITLGAQSNLANLSVNRSVDSSGSIVGVRGPTSNGTASSGAAYLYEINVNIIGGGGGSGYAVYASEFPVEVYESDLRSSGSDLRYAAHSDNATVSIFNSATTGDVSGQVITSATKYDAAPVGFAPFWNDRGAWNVDGAYGEYHASDISSGSHVYHLPTVPLAGRFLVSDGTYWTSSGSAIVQTTGGIAGRLVEYNTDSILTASTLIKTGAGVLTLDAASAYTLTVPATGTVALLGTANVFTANQKIQSTAPSLELKDVDASAKSLTIAIDANLANFRESAGAAGSLLVLGLANNRVGIGGTPATKLHLHESSGGANYLYFTNTDTGTTTNDGVLFGLYSDETFLIWNRENTATLFATNDTERMRITPVGNLLLGTTSAPATGTKALTIASGTAVAAAVTDAFSLYSANMAGVDGKAWPHIYGEDTTNGALVVGVGAASQLAYWTANNVIASGSATITHAGIVNFVVGGTPPSGQRHHRDLRRQLLGLGRPGPHPHHLRQRGPVHLGDGRLGGHGHRRDCVRSWN